MRKLAFILSCLPALAFCQWPSSGVRFNGPASGPDSGSKVAVDQRGNVIVVGTSDYGSSQKKNVVVVKYSATGTKLWDKAWNGPASGDDYGTDIALDNDGNVYVCGIADAAGPSGDPQNGPDSGHFVIVKLVGSNGDFGWPNATESNSVYKFHNGGLVLNDSSRDGWDWFGGQYKQQTWLCAMDLRSTSSGTTIAITGPTWASGVNRSNWRTVVFNEDFSGTHANPAAVKSGWPVDDYGTYHPDTSYDVGLYSDNTVYVTGGHHLESETEEIFTTVRYAAAGNNASPKRIWEDSWTELIGKPAKGLCLVLDRDGNVYAAGFVSGGTGGKRIAVRQVNKDPVNNVVAHAANWADGFTWQPAYGSSTALWSFATSIDLSYEWTGSSMEKKVFVSANSRWGTIIGILTYSFDTLRISDANPSTFSAAHDSFNSSEDLGWSSQMFAIGRGNCYTVGHWNKDYVLMSRRRDLSTRFSAVLTGTSGADDRGFGIVPAEAGFCYYTGESFQTSQDLDFLTLAKTQAVTSFSPSSYTVSAGTGSGSLGNLSVLSTIGGSRATATVDFTASMPESDPTELSISVSGSTDYLVTEVIFVWDNLTAGWLEVARKNSGISGDLTTILPLKDDPRRFIDGSGNVKIRVSYVGSNQQFTAHLGSVGWKVLGAPRLGGLESSRQLRHVIPGAALVPGI